MAYLWPSPPTAYTQSVTSPTHLSPSTPSRRTGTLVEYHPERERVPFREKHFV